MHFIIDSVNSATNKYFRWSKDGWYGSGTELMRLNEDAALSIGSNLVVQSTTVRPMVSWTNGGVLWASNNVLYWTYTAGGTTTNTVKVAGP